MVKKKDVKIISVPLYEDDVKALDEVTQLLASKKGKYMDVSKTVRWCIIEMAKLLKHGGGNG